MNPDRDRDDPIVMLPGLMNTGEIWSWVRAAMPEQASIAITLPPLDDVDAIARAILPDLPERFAVAGFSFGGFIALALAAVAPERVSALALVATNAGIDSDAHRVQRQAMIDRASKGQYAGIGPRLTPVVQHPSTQDDDRILELRQRIALEYGPERFIAHNRATMNRPDRHALLGTLSIPVLIIVGDGDQVAPPAASEAMGCALPAAHLCVIPEAGHMIVLEQPHAIAAALRAWRDGSNDLPHYSRVQ